MILNVDNNLVLFFLIIVVILLIFFVCLKKSNVNDIITNTPVSEGFYDENSLANKELKQLMLYQDNGVFYYLGLFEDINDERKTSIYITSNLKLNTWEFIELKDIDKNKIQNIRSISLNHNGEILFVTNDRIYCKSKNTSQNNWKSNNWFIYHYSMYVNQLDFLYVMFYKSFIENNNIIYKYLILTNEETNNLYLCNCIKNNFKDSIDDQFRFEIDFNINIQDKKLLKISRDSEEHLLALTNDYKLIKSENTLTDLIDKRIKEKNANNDNNNSTNTNITINFKTSHNENILYDYIYDQDGRLYGIGEVDGVKQLLKQKISNYLSPFITLSKLYSIEKNKKEKIKMNKNDIIYFNNGYKEGLHIVVPKTLEDAHYLQRKDDISKFRKFCKSRHPNETYTKNEQIKKFAEKIEQLQEVKNELLKTKSNGVPIN